MTPEEYKFWLLNMEKQYAKRADEVELQGRPMSAVRFRSMAIMCTEALEKFKKVEDYLNDIESQNDAAIMGELDYEREQAEAQAMAEAEGQANAEAEYEAEMEAQYEAEQCYDGEYY